MLGSTHPYCKSSAHPWKFSSSLGAYAIEFSCLTKEAICKYDVLLLHSCWPRRCQFLSPFQYALKTRTKSPRPHSRSAIRLRTSVCSATNGSPSSSRTSAARRMSFSPCTFSPLLVVERNNFRRSRLDSLPVRSIQMKPQFSASVWIPPQQTQLSPSRLM
jgi:hypothetical protein